MQHNYKFMSSSSVFGKFLLDLLRLVVLAAMAKLVYALVSGTSGGNPVEVQVLFAAPRRNLGLSRVLPS